MKNKVDLKIGLTEWAAKNSIRPADFARRTDYTPAYAWSLLRGQATVTAEALGRLALAYGADAVQMVMEIGNFHPLTTFSKTESHDLVKKSRKAEEDPV